MTRLLRPLLLVAALLFSQHAAMLHGLQHAAHEVALASNEGGTPPSLNHGADVCAAFGALAHALGNASAAQPHAGDHVAARIIAFAFAPAVTRVVFDSRAPPLSA